MDFDVILEIHGNLVKGTWRREELKQGIMPSQPPSKVAIISKTDLSYLEISHNAGGISKLYVDVGNHHL